MVDPRRLISPEQSNVIEIMATTKNNKKLKTASLVTFRLTIFRDPRLLANATET